MLLVSMKTKLRAALGSLKDRATMGKAAISSGRSILSDIEVAVLRGTGRHDELIDEKYMHEILFLVSNVPGSITFLARRVSHRIETSPDAVVVLKTLVLVHRLLRGGDRYFEQDLRKLWSSGELRLDLRGTDDQSCSFLVDYSEFLKERMEWIINQSGKLEPIKPSCMEFQCYEEKEMELVLHKLMKCQSFLDRVVGCSPNSFWWSNSRTVQSAMNILLRESFLVYGSFRDGLETVVSSFFNLKKPMRVLALDILNKASFRTPGLRGYYESCKRSTAGKSLDYPCVQVIEKDQILAMKDLLQGSKMEPFDETSSFNAFSCKLETKISTVWVEFEDDSRSSGFSTISSAEGSSSSGKAIKLLQH